MKHKTRTKALSWLLSLVMVLSLVPGMSLTAYADTSDTGIEVLITDISSEHYKDKTTSFTTDDGIANISFSATPSFHEWYGWYNPNGDLTITVTAANDDYPISKCMFQCNAPGREDSTDPFAVTISYDGDWNNTTATINGVSESSGGLKHIGIFSRITPDYTALSDGMLIKPGESIIPGDYYYKTAGYVNTDNPEHWADFKQNTLYTLVKGNIESRQVDPSYNPDWYDDVFVESNDGDHYAFLQVANGTYIFDGSWEVTNHADGLLVSQGTSENMYNPEERITTYAFSVHEKVFNDVTVDSTIENGSIEIKDSEGTAISEAEAGSTVTLDVSANTGYKLKEISAKYLEVQSVPELMELIGTEKCYENPDNVSESNYFEVVDDSIKVFSWMQHQYLYSLPSTVELDKTRSSEGIYTAIGTYDDAPLTWIFKVKNGKIISIGFERNGVDWGIVNIESTGAIEEPTLVTVPLTTVTEGEKYTFTMPAIDVTVNAAFEEATTAAISPAPSYDDDDYTPTITVPVSSDSASVSVTATVSGVTASVKALTETELNKVVNSDTHTGEVEIDVSSLGRDIKTATIPTETVKVVEKAANDATNDATGLTVKLTDGSITLDAQALTAVTEQAKGNTIQLNLDGISTSSMTSAQRETVQTMDVQAVYDAYMTSNGSRISDFHGGKATVAIPYALKAGQSRNGIAVWYIADDGSKTEMPSSFDGKDVRFTVEHFSNYAVVYDAQRAAACPRDDSCPLSAFTDTNRNAWYHDGVHWALENNVMEGVGSNRFNPNGDTTRAMVVTMLWRMESSPAVNYAMSFTDVEAGTWYTEAVRWANAEGIVMGSDGKFAPNAPVTREQLVTMLYRYAQYKNADVSANDSLSSYSDAQSVSEWAASAMQWAVGAGIINGIDGNLAPVNHATRAQVATMLMRFAAIPAK